MRVLESMKPTLGYTWAALCFVLVLAMFVGLSFWERALAGSGLHVSARFSGGEVRRVLDHGSFETRLHRLVFDGLMGDRAEGFAQIDWVPRSSESLPAVIEEGFDLDGDGSNDMTVRTDTVGMKADLVSKASWVLHAEPLVRADSEIILRVRLRNPRE